MLCSSCSTSQADGQSPRGMYKEVPRCTWRHFWGGQGNPGISQHDASGDGVWAGKTWCTPLC